MSDLNTQSAAAVAEIETGTSTQEASGTSVPAGAETRTLEESLSDVVVTGFSPAPIEGMETTAAPEAVVKVPKVFKPREMTNFTVNRRANPDGSYEFIVTDEDSAWLRKGENFVTGSPVGVDATESLLSSLAEETQVYFTVLDSDGDKSTLGDKGDLANLTKLKNFCDNHDGLNAILTRGIRSINIGSRLLQKSMGTEDTVVNGAVTIAYQVEGEEGVMKYRLVGEIARHLVSKIVEIGGDLVTEVVKPAEPRPAKAKKTKVKNEGKQPVAKVEPDYETEQPHHTASTVDALIQGRQPHGAGARPGAPGAASSQDIKRLTAMVEALVVDNREIRKALQNAQGFNQALQRELREYKAVNKDISETNKALLSSLNSILDVLNK